MARGGGALANVLEAFFGGVAAGCSGRSGGGSDGREIRHELAEMIVRVKKTAIRITFRILF
jgi:hypothetical protein